MNHIREEHREHEYVLLKKKIKRRLEKKNSFYLKESKTKF